MADTPVVATAGVAPPNGYGGPTANFNQTVTALVSRTIQENLRRVVRYLGAGGFIDGHIIPGTNLLRYIAYGDLSIPATLLPAVQGTPPWLKEGIRPDIEPLTIGYDEFGVSQAGRLVGVTDIALEYSPHQLMAVAAERVGFNALQTIDAVVASTLQAGTNITWANGKASTAALTAVTDKLSAVDIRKAVAYLKRNNVPTFPDGYYHAFIHPDVVFDLQGDTAIGGWIEAQKYGSPENLFTGEIGRMYGVRFIETPVGNFIGTVGAASARVYQTFIFGPNAWAWGDLQDIRTYTVAPGGDHNDPLAQLAEVGWKAMFGAKILSAVGAKYITIQSATAAL